MQGTYFRWAKTDKDNVLSADILGSDTSVTVDTATGMTEVVVPNRPISPDEARMIGVRLIEGAAIADDGRSVKGGHRAEIKELSR